MEIEASHKSWKNIRENRDRMQGKEGCIKLNTVAFWGKGKSMNDSLIK